MIRRPPTSTRTDALFPFPTLFRSDGTICRAEVVGFRGDRTLLVPLDADAPLENGARVEPDSQATMVQVGEGLIGRVIDRSEEHTSELQSLMRNSYAVFCFKKKKHTNNTHS